MKTGQRIKEIRLKKGLTQDDLAEKTRISARSIQRIENGKVDPRAYSLHAIAEALGGDYEELNSRETAPHEEAGSDDDKIWLPLLHLSGLFCLLFPPVLIWIWKKDHVKHMREHGIDVINFQLSMLIFLIPSAILVITIPIVILIGVFSTVVILVNTIQVIAGRPYRYPLTLTIIKR
jgi:transcriptional regulator with XRE-family HTH domain